MNNKLPYKLSRRMQKDLKRLRKRNQRLYKRVIETIEQIRLEPYIGDRKSGDLSGVYSLDINHAKSNYELAYIIEENDQGEVILMLLFGTRENFYRELKRYIR